MGKSKLSLHPPGTPFEPDRPFETPYIFFVPRRLAAETRRVQTSPENGLDAECPNDTGTDMAYAKFRLNLQKSLEDLPGTLHGALGDTESSDAGKSAAQVSGGRGTASARLPLIPQRLPDLEDIAFEILRQARYKRSKRLW